ncbi:hypothetical protein [Caulobacter sp.]|uniref:hypothetical protein n=1 Tax=Caulobacter sp. TaxID=78 RepID=UPI0025BD36ED|nr:hypothetical protein [Caulobacter sp.]
MAIRAELQSQFPTSTSTPTGPFRTLQPKPQELTSQQKAEVEETLKRTSGAKAKPTDEQAPATEAPRQTWRPSSIGDFTHYTADQAKTKLAMLENLASNPMVKKGLLSATMGDQTTSSPDVMIGWLKQKIGGQASDASRVRPGGLLNLRA